MRSRKAQFLGFCRGIGDDPPLIVFLVEHLNGLSDLRYHHELQGELVVVLSPYPELTSGDFYRTFPATRERSAARIARAEFTYTDAVERATARLLSGGLSKWHEDSCEGDAQEGRPVRRAGNTHSGKAE